MSRQDQRFISVTISLRPGFGLAVKVCCALAMLFALVSPALARRFVDKAIGGLTRLFCRIR